MLPICRVWVVLPSSSIHSFRLFYASSAVRLLSEHEVLEILRIARINNERLGVTGMLLYKEGNFLQVLEGPEPEVLQLIGIIEGDARHHGILRLITRPEKERQFPNWSMAFCNLDEIPKEDQPAFSPYLSSSLLDEKFRTEPASCYKLLRSFKATMR